MNKRIKKKKAKQAEQNIPKGYGLITGCGDGITFDSIHHYHPIGALVKIVDVQPDAVECELYGLSQEVSRDHIIINV